MENVKNYIVQLGVGALCLLLPAFFNGFPFVYSDTGTYILSGFENFVPFDRSLLYGWFIFFTSFGGFSLWGTIFMQAIIGSYLLYGMWISFLPKKYHPFWLLVLLPLSCLTPLGWYVGQLMPDIFTSYTAMVFILWLNIKPSVLDKFLLSLIAILSIGMHLSHFYIVGCFIILFFIRGLLLRKIQFRKMVWPAMVLGASYILLMLANIISDKNPTVMRSGSVFLTARLVDIGIWQEYTNTISDKNHPIYDLKDNISDNSRTFLWAEDGEVNRLGGWTKANDILKNEVKFILRQPHFLFQFVWNSLTSTLSQLTQNSVGSGLVSDYYAKDHSPPAVAFKKYNNHNYNAYQQSRQNTNLWQEKLDLTVVNIIFQILFFSSVLLLVFNEITQVLTNKLAIIKRFVFAFIFSNAFITASFANVYDRLQSRMSWMVILLAVLVVVELLDKKKI